jgi:hypothetical protein
MYQKFVQKNSGGKPVGDPVCPQRVFVCLAELQQFDSILHGKTPWKLPERWRGGGRQVDGVEIKGFVEYRLARMVEGGDNFEEIPCAYPAEAPPSPSRLPPSTGRLRGSKYSLPACRHRES